MRLLPAVLAILLVACNRGGGGGGGGDGGGDAASEYLNEYGQGEFDQAAANNDSAAPGTAQHKQTLGYMTAANDRLQAAGCY
jgi:molybdenum-dependent DNA-binding transcriptional regulator ModE